ncbi:hypothetical protein D3C72_953580 [compost metagenome]
MGKACSLRGIQARFCARLSNRQGGLVWQNGFEKHVLHGGACLSQERLTLCEKAGVTEPEGGVVIAVIGILNISEDAARRGGGHETL